MPPTVVIDPGHGGSATAGGSSPNNATAPNGLHEKDLTLDIGTRVATALGRQATVVLTRTGDDNRSLKQRARVAHDADADVFLSIHFNGWREPGLDGSEAWVATGATPASRALARSVLDRVLTVTHAADRGVRDADLGVLLPDRLGPHTAATLIEVAFLTNPEEAARLSQEGYKQALAQAIADGVAARLPAAPLVPASTAQALTRTDGSAAACRPSALKLALAAGPAYARPLYDTGEHVLTGGDLYTDQLTVGQSPGVAFSYGELIAMGDLYANVDDMMNADPAELTRLKTLIDRSTAFYRGNRSDRSLDVSNKQWDDATGGRYMRLAEDNYEHFSPNTLFTDQVATAATTHGTNKSTWESYHLRAITEAQGMAVDPANANQSYIPVWPLTINAFGDHFLTDAFASGHLINKDVMFAYFRANFFSGSSLNDAGRDFFGHVADAAFVGDVAAQFSQLETTDYPVCFWGWCLRWHPNINSAGRFKDLLIAAAEQETEKVANFAVKALHDRLNREGIEVTNQAGHPAWPLYGDGHLDTTTLGIMQAAVQQSVANINDPAILASNLDPGPFFARVWRFVPRLTPASEGQLRDLVHEYTSPSSQRLVTDAAQIIQCQVDSLVSVLLSEGKLQRA